MFYTRYRHRTAALYIHSSGQFAQLMNLMAEQDNLTNSSFKSIVIGAQLSLCNLTKTHRASSWIQASYEKVAHLQLMQYMQ